MRFIIRSAFWLSLVFLLVPFGGETAGGNSVGPVQALLAAREALQDFAGICERRPDVCETAKAAAATIAARAGEALRLVGSDAKAPEPADPVPPVAVTGGIGPAEKVE